MGISTKPGHYRPIQSEFTEKIRQFFDQLNAAVDMHGRLCIQICFFLDLDQRRQLV